LSGSVSGPLRADFQASFPGGKRPIKQGVFGKLIALQTPVG
jgi:hypothetical protein